MTQPNKSGWEEEFESKFHLWIDPETGLRNNVKQFITSLLTQKAEEIERKLERGKFKNVKTPESSDYREGANCALDLAIQTVQEVMGT
jgi:hypothetical protein